MGTHSHFISGAKTVFPYPGGTSRLARLQSQRIPAVIVRPSSTESPIARDSILLGAQYRWASTTVVHRFLPMVIRMVATARRLADMPISVIAALRPTAAVLRSGSTAAPEPSQRLGAVGRGLHTRGNRIAPVNQSFVTVQRLITDARKLRRKFELRTVERPRPRRLRSPQRPPRNVTIAVPRRLAFAGMMKFCRLGADIANVIHVKSAMSRVSGKSVGTSVTEIVGLVFAGRVAGSLSRIPARNANGGTGANAKHIVSMLIERLILGIRAVTTSHLFGD